MKFERQLLDLDDVKAITGLSTTTIYAHIKEGAFPPPKKCGERAVRWRKKDIEAYVDDPELAFMTKEEAEQLKADSKRLAYLAKYHAQIHTHDIIAEDGFVSASGIFTPIPEMDGEEIYPNPSHYRDDLINDLREAIDDEMKEFPNGRTTLGKGEFVRVS